MKVITFSCLFFLSFLLVTSCAEEEPTNLNTDSATEIRANNVVEKITGQLSFNAFNEDMDWRTFSITALKDADGNVKGTYKRIRRLDGNANNEFTGGGEVLCFDIDGNYANVILYEEIFDTMQHYFLRIYDGGNGKGADSMSQNIPFDPETFPLDLCDATVDLGLLVQGEAGNIKLH